MGESQIVVLFTIALIFRNNLVEGFARRNFAQGINLSGTVY